jgi:hypothetical protein
MCGNHMATSSPAAGIAPNRPDGLNAGLRPWLIRGDVGFGNEPVMREAERRHQPYLFCA